MNVDTGEVKAVTAEVGTLRAEVGELREAVEAVRYNPTYVEVCMAMARGQGIEEGQAMVRDGRRRPGPAGIPPAPRTCAWCGRRAEVIPTGRLTGSDERVIAPARAVAALHGTDAVRKHTGETDASLAYAVALGEAQYYLRELSRIIGRLTEGDEPMLPYDQIRPERRTICDYTGRLGDEGHNGVLAVALAQSDGTRRQPRPTRTPARPRTPRWTRSTSCSASCTAPLTARHRDPRGRRRGHGPRRGTTAPVPRGADVMTGTVYLLHFDQPYKHARHYVGWTARNVKRRLAEHEAGRGARLLAVVREAGIGWQLARLWPGGRARERQIKRQGGHARKCPLCGVTPRCLPRNATGRCRAAGPPTRRSSRPG